MERGGGSLRGGDLRRLLEYQFVPARSGSYQAEPGRARTHLEDPVGSPRTHTLSESPRGVSLLSARSYLAERGKLRLGRYDRRVTPAVVSTSRQSSSQSKSNPFMV